MSSKIKTIIITFVISTLVGCGGSGIDTNLQRTLNELNTPCFTCSSRFRDLNDFNFQYASINSNGSIT